MTTATSRAGSGGSGVTRVLRGQPRWVVLVLGLILAAAALLYTWNIGYSGLSTYYAAAAKSMAASPRAFFFGSVDPTSSITLDKLAGFLVPQVLAVKLFGFHAWALALPQAVEGVISVYFAYVIGARWRGRKFGLVVAALLAFTPMLAAMFGRPMEDGMLTMCQILAFAALQRAILSRSLWWLIGSGAWVAVGFQAKMLQSWLFLPALVVAYLASAHASVGRRILHSAIACVVCVLLSVSWMTAIQLVPASSRPFIDGTTNNNTYSMVFGYNGVDRLIPGLIPGAVPQLNSVAGGGQSGGNSTATSSAGSSRAKLLLPQFTTQIGWLYPLAFAGLVLAFVRPLRRWRGLVPGDERGPPMTGGTPMTRRPPMTQEERASTATGFGLAAWLVVAAVVLSLAFVPHATYFAVIALPLALFAADATVWGIQTYRTAEDWRRIVLPALIVVQAAWGTSIILEASAKLHWLAIVTLAAAALSIALLVLSRKARGARSGQWRVAVIAAGLAIVVSPVAWSLCVLGPGGGGSASDAFAGPRLARPTAATVAATRQNPHLPLVRPPFSAPKVSGLSPEDALLLNYVDARNPGGALTFATDSMPIAVSIILQTDHDPVPMGGFSRQAPTPALAALTAMVVSGRLRFVLLQASTSATLTPPNATLTAVRSWVTGHCHPVLSGRFRDNSLSRQVLYDCR